MDHKTAEELSAELHVAKQFVTVTIGLDTGRLVKSSTHVYFIAPRMGGWEVIEESVLRDVAKVEKKTNFMGDTFIFHTKSGRWTCKDIEDEVDVRRWFGQTSAPISTSQPTQTVNTQSRGNLPSAPTVKEPPKTSTLRKPQQPSESTVGGATLSSPMVEENGLPKLSPDLESIFNTLSNPSSHESAPVQEPNTETIQETWKPSVENSDLSDLESRDDGSSCVVSFLKWGFYIWIFSSFFDLCS